MSIPIPNFLHQYAIFGEDYTGPTYPLGPINLLGVGKYSTDVWRANVTETIVAGIEPNKNVLKIASVSAFFNFLDLNTFSNSFRFTGGKKWWFRMRIRNNFASLPDPLNINWDIFGYLSSPNISYNVVTGAYNIGTSTSGFTGIPIFNLNWYNDGLFHDIIFLADRTNRGFITWTFWADGVYAGTLSDGENPNAVYTIARFAVGSAANFSAGDVLYVSMWELLDAVPFPNPYNLVVDPVVTLFDTYQALNSDGSYQFYDENGIPVILKFIQKAGATPPQIKFVDFGTPYDVIPRINSGDWIDIDSDPSSSLIYRFRYGTDPTGPQTILIDIRKSAPALISVNRNKSNPKIHTSPANNWSLSDDRKNKDLNPLGYLVGHNTPTTTLTKGEKRLTND